MSLRTFAMLRLLAFLLAFLPGVQAAPYASAAEILEGQVVGVGDGDSLTVRTSQGQQITVRLYGVDCPELHQDFGEQARRFTTKLALHKRVSIDVQDVDSYGRIVGVVSTSEGTVLNRELLAKGMAWFYTFHCKTPRCKEWKKAETAARQARLGLWASRSPEPPWDYRWANKDNDRPSVFQNLIRNTTAGTYSGNTNSRIFHASRCKYFNCKRCTVRFFSREAALQAGYKPCKLCKP